MEFDHKISVKNFEVIEVCFRKIGVFCNLGKIIVDSDTYDFAGILTQDIIVGYFKNEYYDIFYSGVSHNIPINPITYRVEYTSNRYPIDNEGMEFEVPFKKTGNMEKDFSIVLSVDYNKFVYELKFGEFITDINTAKKVLKSYESIVKVRR